MLTRRTRTGLISVTSAITALALFAGANATFSASTDPANQQISTGTASIAIREASSGAAWTDPIENLAPGDTVTRIVDLTNDGTLDLTGLTVGQKNLGSVLVSATGISIGFDVCAEAFDATTHECANGAAVGVPLTLLSEWGTATKPISYYAGVFPTGGTIHLRETVHLAPEADNSLAAASDSVTFTFAGEQASNSEDADPAGVFGSPAAPRASTVTSSSAVLTWPAVSRASSYVVETSPDGGTTWNAVANPEAPRYTLTGLAAGTDYLVRIAANRTNETSGFSPVTSVRTVTSSPSRPTITASSPDSVTLTYPATVGATSYRVERSVDGTEFTAIGLPTGTSFTDSTVAPGTDYLYRVLAVNSSGTSAPSSVVPVTTGITVPAAPTVTGITTGAATLTWVTVPGATGYLIAATNPDSSYTPVSSTLPGTATSYSLTGLASGTSYGYRVVATHTGVPAAASEPVTFLTVPGAPAAPSATSPSPTSLAVTWTPVTGASSYVLGYSANGGTTWTDVPVTTGTSKTLTGLTAGTAYTLRITAVNASGSSVPGASGTGFTGTATPTDLASTGTTATGTTLTWTPAPGATGYTVEKSTDGTTWSNAYAGSATTTTITGLTSGTTTYYRLTAVAGAVSAAPGSPLAVLTLPAAPTGLTYSATTTTSTTLSWAAVTGANSYRVETSTDGGTTWSAPATVSSTTTTLTPLTSGSTITARVTAVNATGSGAASSNATVTVPLPAPAGLTHAAIADTTVNLTWSTVPGATSYAIERSTNGTTFTPAGTSTTTSYSVTGLTPGAKYYYRVGAVKSGVTSAWSNTYSIAQTPSSPTGLVGTGGRSTAVLSWNAPAGASSYLVQVLTGGTWTDATLAATNSVTLTGLTNGTAYTYRVTARNADGLGAPGFSNTVTVTPVSPALAFASALRNCPASTGNCFNYQTFSDSQYTIAAGDRLDYWIYIEPGSSNLTIDFTTVQNGTLRDAGAVDTNGNSSHGQATTSFATTGVWVHRVIPIPASLTGQTIALIDFVSERETTASMNARFSDIAITNSAGAIVKPYWMQGFGVPNLTPHLVSHQPSDQTISIINTGPPPS